MLKKRIIPVLLLRNGRMVKGIEFDNYRDTGDPFFASRIYNTQNVDELVFIDIDATSENRKTNFELIEKVSKECFMPLTIGGGIKTSDDVRRLLQVGADKVIINSELYRNPQLIPECSSLFGSQCIIAGLDIRKINEEYILFSNNGKIRESIDLITHIRQLQEFGVGEFLVNSIDFDGKMEGYDIELLNLVTTHSKIPVIGCGGAGQDMHLVKAFNETNIEALAMSSLYHFGDNNPIRTRSFLKNYKINVRPL